MTSWWCKQVKPTRYSLSFCTVWTCVCLSEGIAPVILRLSTQQRRVVRVAPWPLYSREMSPGIHWVGCWMDPVASLEKISWCCQEPKDSPELSALYAGRYADRREWFVYCVVCCSAVLWLHSVVGSTAHQHRHGVFLHAARPVCLGSIWEKACCWWVHCLMCTCQHKFPVPVCCWVLLFFV